MECCVSGRRRAMACRHDCNKELNSHARQEGSTGVRVLGCSAAAATAGIECTTAGRPAQPARQDRLPATVLPLNNVCVSPAGSIALPLLPLAPPPTLLHAALPLPALRGLLHPPGCCPLLPLGDLDGPRRQQRFECSHLVCLCRRLHRQPLLNICRACILEAPTPVLPRRLPAP